jgi:hypothetical protein
MEEKVLYQRFLKDITAMGFLPPRLELPFTAFSPLTWVFDVDAARLGYIHIHIASLTVNL